MTDTSSSRTTGTTGTAAQLSAEPTGWVGWIVFASVMMIIIGILHAIEGFVALFKNSYYVVRSTQMTIAVSYTGWGWLHVIVGVIVAAAGIALISGRMWARVVGVLVALASMLLSFLFISAYPGWSILVIAIDIFVVYALTVHGREMEDF